MMTGFHLDMKVGQYRTEYLEELFPRLAEAGYTHLFFEIEDKVRLESTRGAEWCETWSKAAFAQLLDRARHASLTPIPLIQTLGHLEFLLSHSAYHSLRESPKSAYMLCPSKPESLRFLLRYMDEVAELFGDPPFIHLGADEAWLLGECPVCRERAAHASKGAVFLEHVQKLSDHALSRGCRPILWADMALRHTELLDRLRRDIVWMDWDYWTQDAGTTQYMCWPNSKMGGPEVLTDGFLRTDVGRFAKDAAGAIRPWFYTDYLQHKGYDVIVAPATRCFGDHVFAPQVNHLGNVMSAVLRAQRDPKPLGIVVTSWAARLNPIETQWPAFLVPQLAVQRSASRWDALKPALTERIFGVPTPEFFDAWDKLGRSFTLAESHRGIESDIHYYGPMDSVPLILQNLGREKSAATERADMEGLLAQYAEGARIHDGMAARIPATNRCWRFWRFAAKGIRAKAEEYALFLDAADGEPDRERAARLLLQLEALQDEHRALLAEVYAPASVERDLAMIYAAPWRHLLRLCSEKRP